MINAKKTMVEMIARACHEVNRNYCESIGDYSQPKWENAPAWQRDSAIKGVVYTIENPESTPEDSHISWLKQKENDGWVYGETKDPENKTHPCMVPYSELPKNQQVKDHLFVAVVKSFV